MEEECSIWAGLDYWDITAATVARGISLEKKNRIFMSTYTSTAQALHHIKSDIIFWSHLLAADALRQACTRFPDFASLIYPAPGIL